MQTASGRLAEERTQALARAVNELESVAPSDSAAAPSSSSTQQTRYPYREGGSSASQSHQATRGPGPSGSWPHPDPRAHSRYPNNPRDPRIMATGGHPSHPAFFPPPHAATSSSQPAGNYTTWNMGFPQGHSATGQNMAPRQGYPARLYGPADRIVQDQNELARQHGWLTPDVIPISGPPVYHNGRPSFSEAALVPSRVSYEDSLGHQPLTPATSPQHPRYPMGPNTMTSSHPVLSRPESTSDEVRFSIGTQAFGRSSSTLSYYHPYSIGGYTSAGSQASSGRYTESVRSQTASGSHTGDGSEYSGGDNDDIYA